MHCNICPECREYKYLTKRGVCRDCVGDSIILHRKIPTDASNALLQAIIIVCKDRDTVTWDSDVSYDNIDGELMILPQRIVVTGTDITTKMESYTGTEKEKYIKAINYCIDRAIDEYT